MPRAWAQPSSFFIRLNSESQPGLSKTVNNVTSFVNDLPQAMKIENYRMSLNDVHIKGELDQIGLRTLDDYRLEITEILPSLDTLEKKMKSKFHSGMPISATLDRYFDIGANWAYRASRGWRTKILNPDDDRTSPLIVQTDFTIRTDLVDADFLNNVNTIGKSKPEIPLTDDQIRVTLEKELKNLVHGDGETSFSYRNENRIMDTNEYEDLMLLRIKEFKTQLKNVMRREALKKELKKFPPVQSERECKPMSLKEFLAHVQMTLNTHPLFMFYTFDYTEVDGSQDKYNITLNTNRGLGGNFPMPYDLKFSFSEKARLILQTESSTINPAADLANMNVHKVVSINYPKIINCFIHCDKIAHSIYASSIRRVIKSLQLIRNDDMTCKYSAYFPVREWYDCENITLFAP